MGDVVIVVVVVGDVVRVLVGDVVVVGVVVGVVTWHSNDIGPWAM